MKSEPSIPGKRYRWTRRQIALLGTISDAAVSRELNLCISTVLKKRRKLGIPGTRPHRKIHWTRDLISMLGKVPDAEVAKVGGMNILTAQKKRVTLGIRCYARKSKTWHYWTKKEIALLGTMSDGDVALKIGQKKASVAWKRGKLGIPPFGEAFVNKRPPKPLDSWTRREISVLGTMTDADAARKLDLAHSTVHKKRVSLGIPPFGRR
jgi:hypothetical protein